MSDDPKALPVTLARIGDSFLGDSLLKVAHYGGDAKGRSASKILADTLADPQGSMDGADIYNFDTTAGKVAKASKGAIVPAAVAASPLVLMGLGPVGLALGIVAVGWPALSDNRIVRLFVLNGFSEPIVASEAAMNNGKETAQCARGYLTDQNVFVPEQYRQIPPQHIDAPPNKPAKLFVGLGMFQYEKNATLGFSLYGTAGALQFSCADPRFGDPVGLAFVNGFGTDIRLKLTNQLALYKDLQAFYDAAIENAATRTTREIDNIIPAAGAASARVHACFALNEPEGLKDKVVHTTTERADIVIAFMPS